MGDNIVATEECYSLQWNRWLDCDGASILGFTPEL